jgi:4-diphosphocytidyl-2-C-methyl-D-erythritol kinase
VIVEARAKLNLALAVGPRRADGYHDLATIFQSISLADTIELEPRARGFTLAVRHEEAALRGRTARTRDAAVPEGRANLVLAAARLLAERARLERGARITLIKRIPARAGLGGASADAAATLMGLAALHGIRLDARARGEMALALGSDVPFAAFGGTAIGTGRGERLARARLARPFRAVIALPRWRVATARAFARIDGRKNSLTAWSAKLRSAQLLGRKQIRAEDAMRLGNSFEDVLSDRRGDFLSLRDRLIAAGVAEVRMTGSGSALFGVLEPGSHVREVVGRFRGGETLYAVRSRRSGLSLTRLP